MKDIPVVERDGRFFLQFYDEELVWEGELERTPEQMREMRERHQGIAVRLTAYAAQRSAAQRTLRGRELKKALKDKQELGYVATDRVFELLRGQFQDDFNNGKPLDNHIRMCDLAIARTRVALAGLCLDDLGLPVNKKLLRYFLASWEDAKVFVSGFPAPPSKKPQPVKREREEKALATLHTLSAQDVKVIYTAVGIGRTYTKPGERVAALLALVAAGVLTGDASETHRWGMAQGYLKQCNYETIKKAWDRSEAKQFSTTAQISIFNEVTTKIKHKVLELNILRSTNK